MIVRLLAGKSRYNFLKKEKLREMSVKTSEDLESI